MDDYWLEEDLFVEKLINFNIDELLYDHTLRKALKNNLADQIPEDLDEQMERFYREFA